PNFPHSSIHFCFYPTIYRFEGPFSLSCPAVAFLVPISPHELLFRNANCIVLAFSCLSRLLFLLMFAFLVYRRLLVVSLLFP
ncbi:MAG: hypothetical protein LBC41_04295, partial [Clostridiales bacterium]|nr:hypothetical protein [Clostridiales bacterium]